MLFLDQERNFDEYFKKFEVAKHVREAWLYKKLHNLSIRRHTAKWILHRHWAFSDLIKILVNISKLEDDRSRF